MPMPGQRAKLSVPPKDRIAIPLIRQWISTGCSVSMYVHSLPPLQVGKHRRNLAEARNCARVIDLAVQGHTWGEVEDMHFLETVTRRLQAVLVAVDHGNWEIANGLDETVDQTDPRVAAVMKKSYQELKLRKQGKSAAKDDAADDS